MTEQQRTYRVSKDYQASNTDPFSVVAGETFQVSAKIDTWNGNPAWIWQWCTDQRGKSGWAPQNLLALPTEGTTATARYTYSATELTVTTGEELVGAQEESGWRWCTNQQGKSGWVPLEHLDPLS